MKVTRQQAHELAILVVAESDRSGVPGREPWQVPGVRSLLEALPARSLADLAWAGLTAAGKPEHRTPAGIRHELERLEQRRRQAAQGQPGSESVLARMPVWRPDPPRPRPDPEKVRELVEQTRRRLMAGPGRPATYRG